MRGKHRAFIIYIGSSLLNEKVGRLFFFTLRYKSTIINKNDEKKGETYMAVKRTRESEEMYLETILLLHRKKANVRAVDVCDELGYVKSSVSRGVNLLKKKGYITIDVATGDIEFTDTGRKKAEGIYERHKILTAALCKIGADTELAEENACRIEHVVSDGMMAVFKKFTEQ